MLVPNTIVLPLSKTPVIPTRLPTSPPRASTLRSSGRPPPVPGVRSPDGSLPGPAPVSGGPLVAPTHLAPSLCTLASTLLTAGLPHPVLGFRTPDGSLSVPAPVTGGPPVAPALLAPSLLPLASTLLTAGQPHPVLGFHSPDGSLPGPAPASSVTSDQPSPVPGVRSPEGSPPGPAPVSRAIPGLCQSDARGSFLVPPPDQSQRSNSSNSNYCYS